MAAAQDEPRQPDNLEEWRAAIARGWSVIPLYPMGKKPPIRWKKWQAERASVEIADSWRGQWRGCNLGIVTGEVSGLVVLDVDGADGQLSVSKLGAIPKTPCVKTSRGWHYYFRHPGFTTGNFAGELPGLDFRGDGGYVVGAGSIHESGHLYRWLVHPDECELAGLPAWLEDLLSSNGPENEPEKPQDWRATSAHPNTPDGGRAYVLAALAREARKVEDAPDGSRHQRLLDSAIALGGFYPTLSEREIEDNLFRAFSSRPFDRDYNARQTIRDGISYGERKPREIPKPTPPASIKLSVLPKAKATYRPQPTTDEPEPAAATEEIDLSGQAQELLRSAPLTDAGNAECMAAVFGERFRFDHNRRDEGGWLVWDGNKWSFDEKADAWRAALAIVRARQAATAGIEDADKKKRAFTYLVGAENDNKQRALLRSATRLPAFSTHISDYDRDLWLAATPAGTFDFRLGQLQKPQRDDLITMSLGTSFDPQACAPRWELFLNEVFGDDAELVAFIRRAVGYSLTGDTREQCMFLCYGSGANGKSVFLDILRKLLGDYAGNAAFMTFDADRRSEGTSDLASLRGKRLVTIIEADEDRRLAEARVKAVTGQDPITCRFLYAQEFTYMPTYKLWMAMNHKPTIRGTDHGIWRRIKLIPFMQSFKGKEDKQLAETLRGELPGILNWALDGLHDWLKNGLGTAAVVEAATEEYRKESDLVGQWFDDACASSPASTVLASDAFDSFRSWCKSWGYREPTQNSFARNLTEKGYLRLKLRGKRQWQGFILTDPVLNGGD